MLDLVLLVTIKCVCMLEVLLQASDLAISYMYKDN